MFTAADRCWHRAGSRAGAVRAVPTLCMGGGVAPARSADAHAMQLIQRAQPDLWTIVPLPSDFIT